MPTVIKIEGDAPYLLPHVDHVSAIAHGENVDLTMYVAVPGQELPRALLNFMKRSLP